MRLNVDWSFNIFFKNLKPKIGLETKVLKLGFKINHALDLELISFIKLILLTQELTI
jgi:hypothetical protein